MRATRVALVAIGLAMMAFGAISALTARGFKFRQVEFLTVGLIAHDGFLLPLFLLVGFLAHRFVPGRYRGVVQGALIMSAAVTVVAIPFLLGKGRIGDNPSALPRNYPGGYAIVLGAIWLVALTMLIIRRYHRTGLPDAEVTPGSTAAGPEAGAVTES